MANSPFDKKIMHGSIAEFAKDLALAECFELSRDVCSACFTLSQNKPSSILSAVQQLRMPYPYVWIEWSMAERQSVKPFDEPSHELPTPNRMGCLITSANDGRTGIMNWAWSHDDKESPINICPLTLAFDWTGENFRNIKEIIDALPEKEKDELHKYIISITGNSDVITEFGFPQQTNEEYIIKLMKSEGSRWLKYTDNKQEIIAVTKLDSMVSLNIGTYTIPYYMFLKHNYNEIEFTQFHKSWRDDLTGEPLFIEAFIIMLNSKNIIERKKDDFSKLNKTRSKNRKTPLKEFVVTRLSLSKVISNRYAAAGMNREKARQHLVMGHFKIRKTGVYWWSPFVRNRSNPDVALRSQYNVVKAWTNQ